MQQKTQKDRYIGIGAKELANKTDLPKVLQDYSLEGKVVLIVGGSGSWGKELTRQLLASHKVSQIRIFSRGELRQVEMKRLFSNYSNIKYIIGDIRDSHRVEQACEGADVVFNLAALKHLPVCESNPSEAVATNINGIRNITDACIKCGVERLINASTDKAVDPSSFYGITKACGERLVVGANSWSHKTKFICLRSGNVIASSGSVIPLFYDQIRLLNMVTITDKQMSRYFITLSDVIRLLVLALKKGLGGETFVVKTPAFKIVDIAYLMIEALGNKDTHIKTIGIRPGEKKHEVLVSRYEVERAIDIGEFFVVLPIGQREHPYYGQTGMLIMSEYNSQNAHQCTKDEIIAMLKTEGWLTRSKKRTDPMLRDISREQLSQVFRLEGWGAK